VVDCRDYDVDFINQSSGGFSYEWDFGVNGAMSNDFEPSFTYPDTGVYVVKLIVNKGTTCPDSMSRLVKVYPTFMPEYEFDGLLCPNTPIQFNDISDATYKPVTSWAWD